MLEKYAAGKFNFGTSLLHWKWILLGLFHVLELFSFQRFLPDGEVP
jgi:hypothetical protein